MDSFSKLVELFMRFPGVGSRQAKRFVYFLLTQDTQTLESFSRLLTEIKGTMSQCDRCYRFFNTEHTPRADVCPICDSPNTDKTTMMVVEKYVDIESVQKSGVYHGRFFVLGGPIPLVQKKYMPKVRLKELSREIERAIEEDGLREIVFGLTVNPEGEHTREVALKEIQPLIESHSLKVTTLGRGLSTGTELEYSDGDTLQNALKNRF